MKLLKCRLCGLRPHVYNSSNGIRCIVCQGGARRRKSYHRIEIRGKGKRANDLWHELNRVEATGDKSCKNV